MIQNRVKQNAIYTTDRTKIIDLNKNGVGLVKVNIPASLLTDNSETGTGYTIPSNSLVLDVIAVVNTAETTATTTTIDIGTDSTDSGDADGYFNDLSVAATGTHSAASAAVTTGANETYISTLGGALLGSGVVGTDADGDFGLWQTTPDSASAGKEITATFGDSGGANELDMDLYISFVIID